MSEAPKMAVSEQYLDHEDIHPIDLVEHIAEHHAWEFDRIHDDQIAMAVEGQCGLTQSRWLGPAMMRRFD